MSITISNDSSHLTMEGSTKVTIKASQTIVGTGTKLPIEITGDFKDVPPHLHQLYLQSMWASYGSVNVYNNTDDDKEPMTIEEQKREWRWNKITKLLLKTIGK
jgi:hypothetical protein